MKKLAIYIAALGLSFNLAAQNTSTMSPSSNTVTPGGGIQEPITTQRDKTLVNEAPVEITTRFNQDFPGNTNVNWTQEGKNYKGIYTDPVTHLDRIIVYDKDGNVVRRESQLDEVSSPSGVSNYYTKNYPTEKYQVWQSDDGTGISYFTHRNGETMWFDQQGNYQGNRKSSATKEPKSFNTQQNKGQNGNENTSKGQGAKKGVNNSKSTGTKKTGNPYENDSKSNTGKKNSSKKSGGSSGNINNNNMNEDMDYDKSIPQPQKSEADSSNLKKERKPMSNDVKGSDEDLKDNSHRPK